MSNSRRLLTDFPIPLLVGVRRVAALLTLSATVMGYTAAPQGPPEPHESNIATIDPLPSWRDGEVKNQLRRFVEAVTAQDSSNFVAADQRIAVFDFDGTLVMKKPDYMEVVVAVETLRTKAQSDPSLSGRQPFKAALEQDHTYLED